MIWKKISIKLQHNASDIDKHKQNLPIDIMPLKFPTIHIKYECDSFYMTETSAI